MSGVGGLKKNGNCLRQKRMIDYVRFLEQNTRGFTFNYKNRLTMEIRGRYGFYDD